MTVRLKILTAFSLLLMAATLLSAPLARAGGDVGPVAAPAPVANKFTGWWELGGYYGTDDSSRGEIVLFTPLAQSATTIFFLDARGKFFEEDVQEANLALGYRKMMPSGWNIGVWGGWDIRDTTNDNTFNQISFGFEALSERYDVRVNGYVPLEDSKGVSDTNSFEALLQGNNILVQGTNTDIDELAFFGVDAEFGILLFGGNRGGGGSKGAPAPAGRHELRAYAGGFYFDNDDADDAIAGPKGRLEYRINDVIGSLPGSRLTIESELSYDEVRDTKFEIGARLRIPFGAFGRGGPVQTAYLSAQELRMTEGLERDTDIVTNEETETTVTTEGAIDDATDVALDNVSFAKTADQFAKAVNDGGNRLIILQKGNKRIDVSATDGQQLQDNQTVQGGASTILIRGKKSGEVVPFTAPGKRPTLFTDDTNTNTGAITVANNTHVAGLNIRGIGGVGAFVGGNHGIRGLDDRNNVVLEQNDFKNLGDDAIAFNQNASNIRIWTSDFDSIGNDGIEFEENARNIEIYHTNLKDVRSEGLDFDSAGHRNVTIEKVKLVNVDDPIEFGDESRNVTIYDATIRDADSDAIEFKNNNENIVIKKVSIDTVRFEGIEFGDDNNNVSIMDVSIADAGSEAIDFGSDNQSVEIKHVSITDAGGDGIFFAARNEDVSIAYTEINNAGSRGISFTNDNRKISLMHVNVADTGASGIQFDDNNENVTIAYSEVNKAVGFSAFGISFGDDNQNITVMDTRIRNTASHGFRMDSNNDNVLLDNVQIIDPGLSGISTISNNTNVTVRNSTIKDAGSFGIIMADGNTIKVTDSTFSDIAANALSVFGVNNTLDINGTTFAGTIGQDILDVDNVGNLVNGANNPNNATVGGFVCDLNAGSGAFTGSITIGNQTFVNGAGCNP